jgi:hypothetical protein
MDVSARSGKESAFGGVNFVEGEVGDGAAVVALPLLEEAAVAEGHELGGVDAEFAAGSVDPFGGAFEFGVEADGGFIEDAVAGGVGEFGTVFFVDEGGLEAELGEDVADGLAVLDLGFGFVTMLVAGFGVIVLRQAFVGDDPAVAIFADAEDGLHGAEAAVGGVVEDVALEGAGSFEVKAGVEEAAGEGAGIGDGEFDFDFEGHWNSVQRSAFGAQERRTRGS